MNGRTTFRLAAVAFWTIEALLVWVAFSVLLGALPAKPAAPVAHRAAATLTTTDCDNDEPNPCEVDE
jgi:hypothetical protein